MNDDIRLSTTFFSHRKTKKLNRLLGDNGIVCLLCLWTRVAIEKPCGVLDGWDKDDIEIESNFTGESGVFVDALLQVGFLEKDGNYFLHNWDKRQAWVVNSQDRSDRARLLRMARTHKKIYEQLVNDGCTGLTRSVYNKLTKVQRAVNVPLRAVLTPAPAPDPYQHLTSSLPAPKRKEPSISPFCLDFAKSFYEYLSKEHNGKKKITSAAINAGADTIDKLVRIDGFDLESEIKPALRWAVTDEFWSKQVGSLSPLRSKSKNGEKKFMNLFSSFTASNSGGSSKSPSGTCNLCTHLRECNGKNTKSPACGRYEGGVAL